MIYYASSILPHIIYLKLIVRGNSALYYVETPRLKGLEVKNDANEYHRN